MGTHMKNLKLSLLSLLVCVGAASGLATPASASDATAFAGCTEVQKTAIRSVIADQCGGSGTARVYCSWTGLYEIRGMECANPA